MGLILIPVNLVSLAFLAESRADIFATLAVGGIVANLIPLFSNRGFSKVMAFAHILFWLPLVFYVWYFLNNHRAAEYYLFYLQILFWVNVVSLVFDSADAWKWWRGDRGVAGRGQK